MRRLLSKLDSWVRNGTHHILGFLEDRLAPFTVMILAAEFTFAVLFWGWLSAGESGSTTIRNLVLVIAATAALPLAIWRSKVAERQAATAQRQSETAQRQSETAQRQSETAQRSLLNERYQKGAEMLGSKVLSVRLGGIYALARLAREHPGDYHVQILSLLCAFVRNPPEAKESDTELREDVREVMMAVCARSEAQIQIEKRKYRPLDLSDADLKGLDLFNATLKNLLAGMKTANLEGAVLTGTNLKGAKLTSANLKGADLRGANLTDTILANTNLTRADLTNCKGLTRWQLKLARADSNAPPTLEDAVDADTGKPLVWKGRPIQ